MKPTYAPDLPPFKLFGVHHMSASLVTIILIVAVVWILHRRKDHLNFRRVDATLGILVIANTAFWRVVALVQGEFLITDDLPFHLSGMAPLLLRTYLLKPHHTLFDILYYWVGAGASMALVFPDCQAGFPARDFTGFFLLHGLPLMIVVYLIQVKGLRPTRHSYRTATAALLLYAVVVVLPIDLLLGANYLFLREPPNVDFILLKMLPWPWYIVAIVLFFALAYRSMYQPFLSRERKALEAETVSQRQAL